MHPSQVGYQLAELVGAGNATSKVCSKGVVNPSPGLGAAAECASDITWRAVEQLTDSQAHMADEEEQVGASAAAGQQWKLAWQQAWEPWPATTQWQNPACSSSAPSAAVNSCPHRP